MRVLVVDDEPRYRVYLSAKLGSLGYQVGVAEGGRQAIDLAIGFRPQVLVSDWMLKDRIHGLQVSDALRAVDGRMPTILMTGFPSDDLRSRAREARIYEFIEKPFEMREMVSAVGRAARLRRYRRPRVPFGVIVIDPDDRIVQASERARQMLASTAAGSDAACLDGVFAPETLAALGKPDAGWIRVAPHSPKRIRWWARLRRGAETGLLVLLPERRKYLGDDPRVRMLLDLPGPLASAGLPQYRVLVVDDTPVDRVRYVEPFERLGWTCYKAETLPLARRLLDADPEIVAVLIDGDSAEIDLAELVGAIRGRRDDIELVGLGSALAREREFGEVGVWRFLQKPWRVGDLLHVLEDRARAQRTSTSK